MMRNILVLTLNDLAIAFKNKAVYLIVFIPLFVFVSLRLVDQVDTNISPVKIGIIENYAYPQNILPGISASEKNIEVLWLNDKEHGADLLKERKIDGLLLNNDKEPGSLSLVVLKKESIYTITIVEVISALQRVSEGNRPRWISDIKALHEGSIQQNTLPTWILMMVLLVGCIILPGQVAEEKEKKMILALLQTPMLEVEWLIAKVIMGMILIIAAVLLLHVLSQFSPANLLDHIAFVIAGSFCFSAFGVFLGFLCRSQASARTLGVIFYLPLLIPSALSDVSQKLTSITPFLPSYHLYFPIQSILLEDGRLGTLYFELIYLLIAGSFIFYLSYLLMKKRWLM